MADKSRKATEDMRAEEDKAFIEKNQIKETMAELLSILTANRPKDPLQFMADFFRSTYEQSNRLERCYQTILLCHHSRPAFQRNLTNAYEILSQTKVSKNVHGITGSLNSELIELLLRDFPAPTIPNIKAALSRRSKDAISFEAFQLNVTNVMIMRDYLDLSSHLFRLLDTNQSGQIDRAIAEALVAQLGKSFSSSSTSGHLEACISLSPENIFTSLSQAQKSSTSSTTRSSVNIEEFTVMTADTFLSVLSDNKAHK